MVGVGNRFRYYGGEDHDGADPEIEGEDSEFLRQRKLAIGDWRLKIGYFVMT